MMNQTFHLNVWILVVPFLLPALLIGLLRKDIARRMSDMTGYDARERYVTMAASLAPYPFMIATVWLPFTPLKSFLYAGFLVYGAGIGAFYATIWVFATTPPEQPLSTGPYRLSRNPLYVSATLVFLSICMVTANVLLLAYLLVIFVLQHFMILAEERICLEKYGTPYKDYFQRIPRYLIC